MSTTSTRGNLPWKLFEKFRNLEHSRHKSSFQPQAHVYHRNKKSGLSRQQSRGGGSDQMGSDSSFICCFKSKNGVACVLRNSTCLLWEIKDWEIFCRIRWKANPTHCSKCCSYGHITLQKRYVLQAGRTRAQSKGLGVAKVLYSLWAPLSANKEAWFLFPIPLRKRTCIGVQLFRIW